MFARIKKFIAIPVSKETRGKLLGGAFIAAGIPGLVLPVLQGVLLIGIGFVILSVYSPAVRRRTDALKVRYPRLGRVLSRAEQYITRPTTDTPA